MRIISVIIVSVAITICYCQDTEYIDCRTTRYGCCHDGVTPSDGPEGLNCPQSTHLIGGCGGTQFGCCKDGSYARDLEKSNCKESHISVIKREISVVQTNNSNSGLPQIDSTLILISIGTALFSLVLVAVLILLIVAVAMIVYRIVKQKQARKLRLILEYDDLGVEMGSPLIVEEFGVRV